MEFNVEKLFNEVLYSRIVGCCAHKLCDILFIDYVLLYRASAPKSLMDDFKF